MSSVLFGPLTANKIWLQVQRQLFWQSLTTLFYVLLFLCYVSLKCHVIWLRWCDQITWHHMKLYKRCSFFITAIFFIAKTTLYISYAIYNSSVSADSITSHMRILFRNVADHHILSESNAVYPFLFTLLIQLYICSFFLHFISRKKNKCPDSTSKFLEIAWNYCTRKVHFHSSVNFLVNYWHHFNSNIGNYKVNIWSQSH